MLGGDPGLPPGVTNQMIEDQAGGARDDWPFALVCDHDDAIEALAAQRDCAIADVHDFDGKPTVFDDVEVDDLSVWNSGYSGTECEWVCPECHEAHQERIDQDDFIDPDQDDD